MRRTVLVILVIFAAFLLWRFVRPLNVFVVEDRFALPIHEEVPEGLTSLSARECGGCHGEIYGEWSESMHARAWTDPYYQVDYVFDGSQQICLNCHIPFRNQQEDLVLGFRDSARFDPILRPNPDFDAAFRNEGVTCAACHVRDGVIVGPTGPDDAPHPVKADPGMASGSGPCDRCHLVSGDRWDTFLRIPPCGTVAEIREAGEEVDCVGCHMPLVTRPSVKDGSGGSGRAHFFRGGHHPGTVAGSLKVEVARVSGGMPGGEKVAYEFTLTNIGAAHYLPTGTPDRHLTLELRLRDRGGAVLEEKTITMKRSILWRPFIIDLRDTRLPYNRPRSYRFAFDPEGPGPPASLDVIVRYHLLDESRRKRIGYEPRDPIAYPIFHETIRF